ncbi:MAG: amidohydrolase [Gemmatimonadota bacterium]
MRRTRRVPAGAAPAIGVVLAMALMSLAACTASDAGGDRGNGGPAVEGPADLVLKNGRIVTLDDQVPEAEALAAAGGRILAVGSDRRMEAFIGPETEVIDLEGRLAIPGFIEGHGHYMGLGVSKTILALDAVRSWEEIVEMVAEAAREAETGQWIRGHGWHQEKWDSLPEPNVDEVPIHTSLSAVSPDNPVYLSHASGHAAFVNARALDLAGIGSSTSDPPGGTIVRDEAGDPTGLLRETAQGLARSAMQRDQAARPLDERMGELRRAAALAAEDLLARGVTSFHDAGASFETIDFFKALADEGALPVRLYVMVRASNQEMAQKLEAYRMIDHAGGLLTVRSIKRQVDGALGSHGAWLLEPYDDMPESVGLVLEPLDDIGESAGLALEHGYQLNTHAIGDRANREILDLYEEAYATARAANAESDLRWRIEHAQHVHPQDLPRFAELGVVASMQAIHGCSDAPWVPERLGLERAKSGGYMWRALTESGAVVTNGTDAPVEDVDPIAAYYCTVARRLPDGSVFFEGQEDQRLDRIEALRTYTINNAYAAFEEDRKGTLAPGKYADIVVLSKDILTVSEEEIPEARVLFTIVGGEVKYRAGHADRPE